MQQLLADSPWDPALVVKAVAERVAPAVDVQAWVIDGTGFPEDGKDSPGVKRQYSGRLGKTGNCQIGVSLHAVGGKGTVPLGWALYLPEEWCADPERRRKAKIPHEVQFKTKPELAVELVEQAAGWNVEKAPVLGDCAYGNNTELREELHAAGLQYVLSVSPETTVFAPETAFEVPSNAGKTGGHYLRPRPDRDPESIGALVSRLREGCLETVSFRDGPHGKPVKSRFAFVRVRAAHYWRASVGKWANAQETTPREEWLIAEWPKGAEQPTDYWLANLPASTNPGQLARLARMRWKIELDYKQQLKGELGLDHYEGRSYLGWYHHTALVTCLLVFAGVFGVFVGVFCWFFGFVAAGDGDWCGLVYFLAVLGFEEGGHLEFLAAEVVVVFGGEVGAELAVGAGGDGDFDVLEGDVGGVAEGGAGDSLFADECFAV